MCYGKMAFSEGEMYGVSDLEGGRMLEVEFQLFHDGLNCTHLLPSAHSLPPATFHFAQSLTQRPSPLYQPPARLHSAFCVPEAHHHQPERLETAWQHALISCSRITTFSFHPL